MNLPRSSRRSTLNWVVNAATIAALAWSVWMSAQQRPVVQPQFGVNPPAGESAKRGPPAGGVPAAANLPAAGPGPVALTNTALEGDLLHRVSFGASLTR